MSQSLAQLFVHIVFSTKHRQSFLKDVDLRSRLHGYLVGACRQLGCDSLTVGGVEDHVHLLCKLKKTMAISDLVKELKRESSKWVKQESPDLAKFYWQAGYGAFSISPGHVDALKAYIGNQEEHHRQVSFQDEFRHLCAKYGVEFDERYVWD